MNPLRIRLSHPLRIPMSATVLASLAVLALATLPCATLAQGTPVPPRPAAGPEETGMHVIVVTSQGSVEAAPDQATVDLGIQVTRPTAQEAQDQSAAIMDRVIRQVMALGVARDKIRTITVSLFPVRRPAPQPSEISGYQSTNRIMVTVDDLRLPGKVIDAAVAAGANTLDSLTFGLRDPSLLRIRALQTAVERARTTADAIASAAGVSNLRLVRIDEVGAVPVPRIGLAAPALQGVETPVMPGTLTVTVQVRAVYAF